MIAVDNLEAQDIVVAGDSGRMEQSDLSPYDVTFHCYVESFVLLMCGRVSVESLKSKYLLLTEGDSDAELQFIRWFNGL
jgi:hypothetical protein